MNFFKSVFSDDPDEDNQSLSQETSTAPPQESIGEADLDPKSSTGQSHFSSSPSSSASDGAAWSFGGLLKTISTHSESVLETYRRDLKEFGSGLKQETAAIREAASRAVKELPASIEVAHGSLETVGHAIDELGNSVWRSTAEIVSHGKDSLLPSDVESDFSDNYNLNHGNLSASLKRQGSRFDTRVRAIQSDSRTYCEEPEDLEDFNNWKLGFVLEEKSEEVEKLIAENGAIESVYKRVVPSEVDHGTFWCRYFYKIYRLKQAEDVRANLVKRAISKEDDEDLRWDDDDDDDENEIAENAASLKSNSSEIKNVGTSGSKQNVVEKEDPLEKKVSGNDGPMQVMATEKTEIENPGSGNSSQSVEECSGKELIAESAQVDDKNGDKGPTKVGEQGSGGVSKSNVQLKQRMSSGETSANIVQFVPKSADSPKASNSSVVPNQPSVHEEEDLGWDETEDLGWDETEDLAGTDEKKATHGGRSPNRADLRKRLSVTEDEEDLSWDIEDEEE